MGVVRPACNSPVSWSRRLFGAHAWAKWTCRGCGARLKFDFRHRTLVIAGIYLLILAALTAPRSGLVSASAAGTLAFVALFAGFTALLFLERVKVVEYGPRSCPTCGYDRTGLPSDRCPECGRQLIGYKPNRFRDPSDSGVAF